MSHFKLKRGSSHLNLFCCRNDTRGIRVGNYKEDREAVCYGCVYYAAISVINQVNCPYMVH